MGLKLKSAQWVASDYRLELASRVLCTLWCSQHQAQPVPWRGLVWVSTVPAVPSCKACLHRVWGQPFFQAHAPCLHASQNILKALQIEGKVEAGFLSSVILTLHFLATVQTFSFSLHAWGESLPWEVLRVSSSECPWGQGSSWSYKRARSWVRKRCWGQTFIRFSQIALCQSRRDICSPSSIFPNLLYAPDCRINNGCGSRCRAE